MESKLSFDSGKQQMHQVYALYSDMRQGTEPAGMGCAESVSYTHLFQDPQKGTSPSLTILQNMAMAYHKGKSFGLTKGVDKALIPLFERELADMQLGLESKLHVSVGSLSGGQRQALSLLMATLITPQLLLLDEHTAALDPKTSDLIIQLTKKIVEEKKMTTIMITHNLKHAITCLLYTSRCV